MTNKKQIFEVEAGLYVGRKVLDTEIPCAVTVIDDGNRIEVSGNKTYTAVRGPAGWVWTTGANSGRAGEDMQRHLSRLASQVRPPHVRQR